VYAGGPDQSSALPALARRCGSETIRLRGVINFICVAVLRRDDSIAASNAAPRIEPGVNASPVNLWAGLCQTAARAGSSSVSMGSGSSRRFIKH
jgi:hypothetical protein